MSVIQVFLGRPRDLLPSIFPSISCICDVLCLIRCPRYCSFLVLNCLTISLPVPIVTNCQVKQIEQVKEKEVIWEIGNI